MFARLFIDHPASVGEGYFHHMGESLKIGGRLLRAALGCVVHAFVPGLCKTTGSTAILTLAREISPRRFDQPTF